MTDEVEKKDDLSEMQLVTAPAEITGDDHYCDNCGRLLVKINDDGTFLQAQDSGIRGGIMMNKRTGEETGRILDAICQLCYPNKTFEGEITPEMFGLPPGLLLPVPVTPEIGKALAAAVAQAMGMHNGEAEQIDKRIKSPWDDPPNKN